MPGFKEKQSSMDLFIARVSYPRLGPAQVEGGFRIW